MEEKRICPRLISKKDITVTLKLKDGRRLTGRLYDVSKNGISVIFESQISNVKTDTKCKLEIIQADQMQREFNAEIKWKRDKRLGLKIEKSSNGTYYPPPFNNDSLIGIISAQEFITQLAFNDRKIVLKEANTIKVCSSNYFMWTVGALIPLIVTIWTLFIQNKITPSSCSGVMLGMFVLYCMSFFSLIEKARAINKREGFVAALDYFLITYNLPENYPGWIQLKHAFSECETKRRLNQCSVNLVNKKGSIEKQSFCKNIATSFSSINSSKRLLPSILDSFVSLILLFYGFLYVVILLFSLVALSKMFNGNPFSIEYVKIFLSFILGYGFGLYFGYDFRFILLSVATVIVTIFFHALNYDLNLIKNISWIYIPFVIFPLGFFYGSVLNRIFCQFIKLRKREYSFESFFYIWLNIMKYCSFMPDVPNDSKKLQNENDKKIFQTRCGNI